MKVISFYSFKGGAGRTVTSMNVAAALAKTLKATKEEPILIIDADIDSAGATILTNTKSKYKKQGIFDFSGIASGEVPYGTYSDIFGDNEKIELSENIIDFFGKYRKKISNDYNDSSGCIKEKFDRDFVVFLESKIKNDEIVFFENKSFKDVIYEYNLLSGSNELLDISDILGSDEYNSIKFLGSNPRSIVEINNDSKIAGHLYKFKKKCEKQGYKAIVFDCASGFQSIAQSVLQISTDIVLCTKVTTQFREGTIDFLENYYKKQRGFLVNPEFNQKIHVLPTVVPPNVDGFYEKKIKQLQDEINIVKKDFFNTLNEEEIEIVDKRLNCSFFSHGGISEVNQFKWEEGILNKMMMNKTLTEDESLALTRYRHVANEISAISESGE